MIRDKPVDFYSGSNIGIVLSGLVGLALAVFILLGFAGKGNSRFHEILFDPRAFTGQFLDSVKLADSAEFYRAVHTREALRSRNSTDTAVICSYIDTLRHHLNRIAVLQFQWQFGNKDTAFNSSLHYSINRQTLYNCLVNFGQTDTLTIGYFDLGLSPNVFAYRSPVNLKPYPTATDFFSKYPSFALWIFLGIAQMVIWFLALPICAFIYKLVGKNEAVPFYKKPSWIKSFILAFVAVGVFCSLLYFVIIDRLIIQDVYFMDGFVGRLIWYALFGYLVSVLSFTGYLFIANHIYQLQKDFQAAMDQKQTDTSALKDQYRIAKKYFSIYLYITATVLSIVVLWVGSLFSSVNSMDAMRYYKYISGLDFLPNDFVYLFGGLHSLLLLIFFLPVELNMFTLNSAIPELEDKTDPTSSWGGLLKSVGGNLGNLLVVSSPILASILHGIISSYSK